MGVGVLKGFLYSVGGYDGASRQCLSSVERFDPVKNEWELVCDMTVKRSGAGVGVLGELKFVFLYIDICKYLIVLHPNDLLFSSMYFQSPDSSR